MPRWFTAFFVALMLSCYGFAVFAHSATTGIELAEPVQAEKFPQLSLVVVKADPGTCHSTGSISASTDGNAADADDDSANALDEYGSEHFELVGALQAPRLKLLLSEHPPKLALTPTLQPFPERPQRPPRVAAFSA